MPKTKRTRKARPGGLKARPSKPMTDRDQEKVKGGKTPAPGGPVPIPYPNIGLKSS